MHLSMYVYMYYACIYMCVYLHVRVHVCVHVCVPARVHRRMYACEYVRSSSNNSNFSKHTHPIIVFSSLRPFLLPFPSSSTQNVTVQFRRMPRLLSLASSLCSAPEDKDPP